MIPYVVTQVVSGVGGLVALQALRAHRVRRARLEAKIAADVAFFRAMRP